MLGKLINNPKVLNANHELSKFGLDFIKFVTSIKPFLHFRKDFRKFKRLNARSSTAQQSVSWAPQLGDISGGAGIAEGHYFWQDLIAARRIYNQNPSRHLDIGSRVDGFIAHLLVFRHVEIVDIRSLESFDDKVIFQIGNAMDLSNFEDNSIESISSLHAIEHFGLGRYGDNLDPDGHIKALREIQRILKPNGKCYISFPAGNPRVLFNDKRIVDPSLPEITMSKCDLVEFIAIPGRGKPIYEATPNSIYNDEGYCGLWIFQKRST